jgi:Holliday junction resolvase
VNSKRKGKRGELNFANFCKSKGFQTRRGQQYNGIEGEDVVGIEGVHVEVKRTEFLRLYEAMKQSIAECQGKVPIVAHRKNNEEWVVIMRAEDFLKMVKENANP